MRLHTVPSLLIIATTALAAADQAQDEPVRVKDFVVAPMGNLVNDSGTTRLHLKALLGAGYDSNLYATEKNETSDAYLRGLAGFEIRHRGDGGLSASLDAYVNSDKYIDEEDRDLLGGRGIGTLKYEGETARLGLTADYELYDDPLVQTGEQVQRETWGGLLSLGWEGARTTGALTADAHRTDYLEDVGGFVAEDRNVVTSKLGFRYAYKFGEEDETWLRVSAGSDTYDTNNRLQDDTMAGGYVGGKIQLGQRAKLLAEVGALWRKFSREFALGYDDEEVVLPEGSLALVWPWNDEGSLFSLRAYAESRTSLTSNAMSLNGLAALVRVRASQQIILLAGLEGTMIADTASAPGADAEERSTGIGTLGLEYHAMDGFAVRLIGRSTVSEAEVTTSNDYTRNEAILETAVVF